MFRREPVARIPGPGPAAAGKTEPVVVLQHVCKAYKTGSELQAVLRDVSLEILGGEFVVVLGPSGCGKTTLLNLLGGLDTADTGSIQVCGHDLSHARQAELTAYRARSVGFVFQFYNLLPTLTALENVEAGAEVARTGRDQARVILDRVGLAAAAKKFPAQLSGGEQQRVAIARALAKSPQLVLADEPTGNLDQERAAEVLVLMRQLNEQSGTTFVVVSHNPAVAAMGTRVVRLGDGQIVQDTRQAEDARP
jgi:putative ABC transport system ATP-binding protein